MKVTEAVAPAAVDCIAESPLHPQLESLRVHAPLKLTAAWVSSTRMPAVGKLSVGGGGGGGVDPCPEELSPPPPPPPHETSRAASNKTTTRGR
jgi:hypothetical protein